MSGQKGNQPPRLVAHDGVDNIDHGVVPLLMLLSLSEHVWLIHNLQVKCSRYLMCGLAGRCRRSEDVVNPAVTVLDAISIYVQVVLCIWRW
jgi:hypothetical protein